MDNSSNFKYGCITNHPKPSVLRYGVFISGLSLPTWSGQTDHTTIRSFSSGFMRKRVGKDFILFPKVSVVFRGDISIAFVYAVDIRMNFLHKCVCWIFISFPNKTNVESIVWPNNPWFLVKR